MALVDTAFTLALIIPVSMKVNFSSERKVAMAESFSSMRSLTTMVNGLMISQRKRKSKLIRKMNPKKKTNRH